MAVSATVLPPAGTQALGPVSLDIAGNGIARLETAAPTAGAASRIVMVTLSSPTNSFAPVAHAATLVMGAHGRSRSGDVPTPADALPAQRLRYELDMGRPPTGSDSRVVSVRISYLIVPGGT